MIAGVWMNPMNADFREQLSRAVANTNCNYPEIDGLRVIAALHIMVFHLDQRHVFGGRAYTCSFCGFGKYWVQAFFTISGFLSAITWYVASKRRDIVLTNPCKWMHVFVLKRVVRWLPLYLLSFVLAIIGRAVSSAKFSLDGTEVALSVFMIQSWFPPFYWGLNGVPTGSLSIT